MRMSKKTRRGKCKKRNYCMKKNKEKFVFQNVLNDILNQQLDAETPAIVLSHDQFECIKDNSVVFSGYCRCVSDEKIDVCFYNGDVVHIGDNLKSICFSKSFNVVIEEIENNAFVSLVKLKDIVMHHNKEKKSHKLSFMSIDYSSQHVTNEDTQCVILNAVTKMEISDSKCFFTKKKH